MSALREAVTCIGRFFLVFTFVAALAGCGKKDEQAAAPNSQIVARVGDQVVTIQELDTEFRWANVSNDKRRDPDIVKQVMGELVKRKYLVQQAIANKMDREPTVLLDMLRAREQVLANAIASRQIAAKISAINKGDVDKYISNNPRKFANQVLIGVEQITFALNPNTQSIVDEAKSLNSLNEVDRKLTAIGIPHNRSNGVLNSAEIPDELLNALQANKPEDVVFARAGQNGVFLQVKSREPRHVEGEAGAALARQLMRNDMLKAEAAEVSFSANMEAKYEGDYAKIMGEPAKASNN